MKKLLLILFTSFLIGFTSAQESIIKDFGYTRRPSKWMNPICLYPSTLRMINVSGDSEFNKLVNDIEKVLIYTFDSATVVTKSYGDLIKSYEEVGYEEYITMYGKQLIKIIGKKNEYVGIMAVEDNAIGFYLRGDIPFAKIPELMRNFQEGDLLPIVTDRFK